ncbi:hypothetical protein ACW0JT_15525 [Arthrobacter sp. SA17]
MAGGVQGNRKPPDVAEGREGGGARIPDQEAQHAVPCGKRTYPVLQLAVDPHTDKSAEGLILTDDAEGAVAGMEEAAGGLNDPLKHGIEAEVFGYSYDCFKEPRHPFLRLEKLACPGNKIFQEVFDPKAA